MSRFYKPEITEIKKKSKSKRRENTNVCVTGGGKNSLPSYIKKDGNTCLIGTGKGKRKNACYSGTD